jgi:hypothetical protein
MPSGTTLRKFYRTYLKSVLYLECIKKICVAKRYYKSDY